MILSVLALELFESNRVWRLENNTTPICHLKTKTNTCNSRSNRYQLVSLLHVLLFSTQQTWQNG